MSEPYLGEIKIAAFQNPPNGWALCNGQLLPINQNQALFSILGTRYGGDGQTNFALPNLQGCVPIHRGGSHDQGEKAGQDAHTITISELPAHTHLMMGLAADGAGTDPTNAFYAKSTNGLYDTPSNLVAMPQAVTAVGGSQPHENRQPFLALTFIIALQGIFPSRN
ncbi:MAG TPA: tail fiber protein [Acidimicrobiales bacterium]